MYGASLSKRTFIHLIPSLSVKLVHNKDCLANNNTAMFSISHRMFSVIWHLLMNMTIYGNL